MNRAPPKSGGSRSRSVCVEDVDVVPLPVEVEVVTSGMEVGRPKPHSQHGTSGKMLSTEHPYALLLRKCALIWKLFEEFLTSILIDFG